MAENKKEKKVPKRYSNKYYCTFLNLCTAGAITAVGVGFKFVGKTAMETIKDLGLVGLFVTAFHECEHDFGNGIMEMTESGDLEKMVAPFIKSFNGENVTNSECGAMYKLCKKYF